MNKVHVIVNPISARGRTAERWSHIREIIRSVFREFRYVFTEKPHQAVQLTRELLQEGYDLIIGVGGDGTLNEIANGFFKDDAANPVNEEAALAIVPSGTGSDFVHFHRLPRDFRLSVERIHRSSLCRLDVGRVTFSPPGSPRRQRYFVNVADFGLGADVIRHLEHTAPQKRNAFTYYRGLLSRLAHFRAPLVKVEIDGRESVEGRFLIGAVANGAMFGGGMIIAPHARADDGRFDLTRVPHMSRLEIVANTPRLYLGTIDQHAKVSTYKANRIQVTSAEAVVVECDGDLAGALPAEFDVFPQKLNFRI